MDEADFDSRSTLAGDLIRPRRSCRFKAPERKARQDLVDAARLHPFYSQPWKVEPVV